MSKIRKGQKVTFRCTSSLVDGTSLDDPEDNEPMTMTAGVASDNKFASAISQALVGMEAGKTKKLTLAPKDAFGEVNEKKIVKVPAANLPEGLAKGDVVSLETDEGSDEATVISVAARGTTLDFNHPLAGQPVVLEIEVIKVAK